MRTRLLIRQLGVGLLFLTTAGCAGLATHGLSQSIATGVRNQNDPTTVRDGMPAYLLMIDGLIAGEPKDTTLLIAGAQLYGVYATVFVDDEARARRLARKALDYARRAICRRHAQLCGEKPPPFDEVKRLVDSMDGGDLPTLYAYAAAWAGLIQVESGDWGAVADLPKVEAMMQRVVTIDERYDHGMAHLYLGVMRSQVPAALGGHPEIGRAHFELAVELSGGRNLIAKVEFARNYARLVYDKSLHDRLLNEVLAADPVAEDLTLSNILAKQQARKLLEASGEYFNE